MSESVPVGTAPDAAAPPPQAVPQVVTSQLPPITPALDARQVCAALGHRVRWRLVRELRGGEPKSIKQLAAVVRRDADTVGHHLEVLRRAGVVMSQPGVDRRYTFYFIPPYLRRGDGVRLESCTFRF